MIVAFDDTDSDAGGCTTRILLDVLASIDAVPLGLPRLVRLNPNIPYKTRGNGAVCIRLGSPRGPQTRIGEWRGMEAVAYPEGEPMQATGALADRLFAVLQEHAETDADPGLFVGDRAPPSAFYWTGVQGILDETDLEHVEGHLRGGRGRLGAVAAAAWPGPASSYEFIAYRAAGQERRIDPDRLRGLDQAGCFHTWDPEVDRPCCIPSTPDPVLVGLRGRDPDLLRDTATRALTGADVDAWLLYATNQASGDHIVEVAAAGLARPLQTIRLLGTVDKAPENLQGGHVRVPLLDRAGDPFAAIAFEPTGRFRDAVRALAPGDRLAVQGAWKDQSVQLEAFELLHAADRRIKTGNPVHCGRPMKSRGKEAGFRCRCGHKEGPESAVFENRPAPGPGWYEVPVRARRHLHAPGTGQSA